MADNVDSCVMYDGDGSATMKFTNISDGTGESGVLKVDMSTLKGFKITPTSTEVYPCVGISIKRIHAITVGMGVDIMWAATADAVCCMIGADQVVDFNVTMTNNAGSGKTGNILFTTVGASSGDRYTVVLELVKHHGKKP